MKSPKIQPRFYPSTLILVLASQIPVPLFKKKSQLPRKQLRAGNWQGLALLKRAPGSRVKLQRANREPQPRRGEHRKPGRLRGRAPSPGRVRGAAHCDGDVVSAGVRGHRPARVTLCLSPSPAPAM